MLDAVESQLSVDDLALFNNRKRTHDQIDDDPIYKSWFELKSGHESLLKDIEDAEIKDCLQNGNKSEVMKKMLRYVNFHSTFCSKLVNIQPLWEHKFNLQISIY